jgi:CHAT domain-containing protein
LLLVLQNHSATIYKSLLSTGLISVLTFFASAIFAGNESSSLTNPLQHNFEKALQYQSNGQLELAIQLYSINAEVEYDTSEFYLRSIHNLARIYNHQREYLKARQSIQKAFKDENRHLKYPDLHATSLFISAQTEDNTGNYAKADSLMQQSLRIRRKIYKTPHRKLGNCLMSLGKYQTGLGNYSQALSLYELARREYENNIKENGYEMSSLLFNIGNAHHKTGNYKSDIDYKTLGLKIQKKYAPNDYERAAFLHNIGVSYLKLGDYNNSYEYSRMAANLLLNKGPDGLYSSLPVYFNGMGFALQMMKRYDEALDYHHKSIDFIKLNKDKRVHLIGLGYSNIGVIYREQKNFKKSLYFHHKANSVLKKTTAFKFYASNQTDLGKTYMALQMPSEARRAFDKAISILRENQIFGEATLAEVYYQMAELNFNQKKYTQALNLARLSDQQNLLRTIGDSTTILKFPLNTLKSPTLYLKSRVLSAKVLSRLAKVHKSKQSDYLIRSIRQYSFAIAVMEQVRKNFLNAHSKLQLYEDFSSVFEESIQVAMELYDATGSIEYLSKAFEFSEIYKAGILLEAIRRHRHNSLTHIPDSLLTQERNLNTLIAFHEIALNHSLTNGNIPASNTKNLSDKLFDLKQLKNELVAILQRHYASYYDLIYQKQFLLTDDIQKKIIDDSTALIEFYIGDSVGFVFAITQQNISAHQIENLNQLKQEIQTFRRLTTNINFSLLAPEESKNRFSRTGFFIYKTLIAPLRQRLPDKIDHLIVVTDGELGHINLEILPVSLSKTFSFKKADYLIHDFIIQYAYSASVLTSSIRPNLNEPNAVFAGFAPGYQHDASANQNMFKKQQPQFTDLPGAASEVVTIANSIKGDLFLGEKATKSTFKEIAGKYQILHLAMHGLLDDTNPLFSKLIFARDKEAKAIDYGLNTVEIFNLNLTAEMVVLSACNTGSGKIHRGEGIMSLSRAFKYAGAKSLLMSLWQIPDKATQQIMVEFYDNLLQGKRKDTALREAKLSFLENVENPIFAHPYYWSGLIAIGDMSPISTSQSAANDWYWLAILLVIGAIFAGRILSRKKIPQL